MAKHAPQLFQETVGGQGVWLSEASLEDCLSIADRVVAVNSTVLYEALMMNKPVLCMGQGLLSGKGIAYEVENLETGKEVVDAFLTANDFEHRRQRWIDFGANLFAHHIYTMNPPEETPGQRGAEEFAKYLIEHATSKEETRYDKLHLEQVFVDAVDGWDDARIRLWILENEHTGIKEVLRGLNIALKASLG